jgi:hypothetical protein
MNREDAFQDPDSFILFWGGESSEAQTPLAYIHCHALEKAVAGVISRNIYYAVRKIAPPVRPSFFVIRSHSVI